MNLKGTCRYSGLSDKKFGNLYSVSKLYMSQQGNDQALMELLDKYGPVTIGFDASSPIFNSYAGGIFASPKSSSYPMCTTKIGILFKLNYFRNSFILCLVFKFKIMPCY
jgi:hypothetical protein